MRKKKSLALAFLLTSAAFGQTNRTDIAIHCVSLPLEMKWAVSFAVHLSLL